MKKLSDKEVSKMKSPMQPVYCDKDGVIRFKENEIVRRLLDEGGINLNDIACWDVSQEDREQFGQLIGYSVSGYGTLSYVSNETCEAGDKLAEDLTLGVESDPRDALILSQREQLDVLKETITTAATTLFNIHPDDLTGEY